MDITSRRARVILRQIRFQIALAKRRGGLVDVAELASRLARKHRQNSAEVDELSDEITIRAAQAGLPILLSKSR